MARWTRDGRGGPRPDLTIPQPAPPGVLALVLAVFRLPRYGAPSRQRAVLVAIAALLLTGLVLNLLAATVAGVVLALHSLIRMSYLEVLERKQAEFERRWLADHTVVLRDSEFELVRFTLDGRGYDLGDAEQVAHALRLAADADSDAAVILEFVRPPQCLERTRTVLDDVDFRPVAGARPRVRFPNARCRPGASGRRTSWQLSRPAVITVAGPAAHAATRDGTGRQARPTAGHPAGELPAGTA